MKLRACVLGMVASLGCKGADHGMEKSSGGDKAAAETKSPPAASSANKAPATPAPTPSLAKAALLVADPRPYAIGSLVWVDDKGQLATAKVGDDWRKAPTVRTPVPNADELKKVLGIMRDDRASAVDDPPPPEEPEGDEEEASGGTGTAMTLEEGKMGKKDADRAEGTYRMKRAPDDPVLARRSAIERAREAGILGGPGLGAGRRVVGARGVPVEKLVEEPAVFAPPGAPAVAVVRVLEATGGALAVTHEDKLGVFAVGFTRRLGYRPGLGWIELHVTADGVRVIEARGGTDKVQAVAHASGAIDRKGLAAAIGKLVTPDSEVDVVVADGTTAQHLVDTLVALDDASVRHIALGVMMGSAKDREASVANPMPESVSRGRRSTPMVSIGSALSAGELDKAIIRRYIKVNLAKISYCYEKELLAKPTLAGVVSTEFLIGPDGRVTSSSANGVDPAVASCIAAVIKGITFPRPKTGSVQVNYPFIMRPAGE